MKTTLAAESVEKVASQLRPALTATVKQYPGDKTARQPVHTVYGGAHLFKAETAQKLGSIARKSLETYVSDQHDFAGIFCISPNLAGTVLDRVKKKLTREAVEDLRVDFEDGYGVRSNVEEDGHAGAAALETAKAMREARLPPFFGIRIKSFSEETLERAIRTLDIYLSTLCGETGGKLPDNFVVTLPKVVLLDQVTLLVDILDELEPKLGIQKGTVKIEIMVETVQSIISPDGGTALPGLVNAARGRCVAAHFGAYDYTAECGITAPFQNLRHPACDFARHMMQVSLGKTGIRLSDGATTVMPIPPHRGDGLTSEQSAENRRVVHAAWKLHYDNCRHALETGYYQGWDLHPAQIPARYAAVYTFFLEGLDQTSERLQNFIQKAAQATLVGNNFDDAATGQGLLNFFTRAINCGAVTEAEVLDRTGLSLDHLRSGSFSAIIRKTAR
ncbi:MAG: phosphoenolpyruvate kinase [Pyrinomonadaceae bacterium]